MEEIMKSVQIAGIVAIGRTVQAIAPLVDNKAMIKNVIWIVKTALIIKTQMGF